jgi:6-phosphogluconolactonase
MHGAWAAKALPGPAEARYVYTANFLSNTVSGLALPPTGALSAVQNTPFKAAGQPTCPAAITHGNHSIEAIQPQRAGNVSYFRKEERSRNEEHGG